MKAVHDDKTFTLIGKYWSGTYPIEQLGEQLAFYRSARERFPKSGTAYDATIEALEELANKFGA